MSIQRPSCFFNLCSSCSSRSNKRRRDCLLPPPRGRLCCRAGLTAPPYSHRWPSHPSTHPHLLLFSGDGRRTSKPSYSRTPLRVGNNCRAGGVFIFLCVIRRHFLACEDIAGGSKLSAAVSLTAPTTPTAGQAIPLLTHPLLFRGDGSLTPQ